MTNTNCPHCGVSLKGDLIPGEFIAKGHYGTATHWRREIGIVKNDHVAEWECPDCRGRWPGVMPQSVKENQDESYFDN